MRHSQGLYLERIKGTSKSSGRIACDPAETGVEYLLNTNIGHCFSNVFACGPTSRLIYLCGLPPFLDAVTYHFISTFCVYEYVHTHTHTYTFSGVCYNEEFLSIKSRCYNKLGRRLSADVARACA